MFLNVNFLIIFLSLIFSVSAMSEGMHPSASDCEGVSRERGYNVDCKAYELENSLAMRRSLAGFGEEIIDQGWSNILGREYLELKTSDWWDYNSQHYIFSFYGRGHGGLDIAGSDINNNLSVNDDVFSIDDGIVSYICRQEETSGADNCEGGKNDGSNLNVSRVLITHKDSNNKEFVAVYGHVYGESGLEIGSEVSAGQKIGKLKKYGSPVHIHFAIIDRIPENGVDKSTAWDVYNKDIQIDPEKFFIDRYSSTYDLNDAIGRVNSVSPTRVQAGGIYSTFNIYGDNFPSDMTIELDGVNCSEYSRLSSSHYSISCLSYSEDEFWMIMREEVNGKEVNNGRYLITFEYPESVPVEPTIASISSLSPVTVINNQRQTFTVLGSNFPTSVAFSIQDCANGTLVWNSSSNVTYSCIPRSTGDKLLYGAMESGGTPLTNSGYYTVSVSEAVSEVTVGSISGISPTTATLNQRQEFTITGSNFPSTVAFSVEGCDSGNVTRNSSSNVTYSCIPRSTGGKLLYGAMESSGTPLTNSGDYTVSVSDSVVAPELSGGVNIVHQTWGFKLNWREASGDVSYYELYRSEEFGQLGSLIYTGSSINKNDILQGRISTGTTLYYTARACNEAGCDSSSQSYNTY